MRSAVASTLSRAVEADPTHANAVMPLLLAMLDNPDRLDIPDASDVPDHIVIRNVLSLIKITADADISAAKSAVPRLLKMFAAATPLSKAAITEALGYVACQDPNDARQAAELSVTLLRDEDRSVQPLRNGSLGSVSGMPRPCPSC